MQLLKHFHELSLHLKNAKELKGLILQLAVHGKLTKQWRMEHPNLESGEKLFLRIKYKKVNTLKNGRAKIEKVQKKVIDEEVPFSIPETWIWCKLNDISSINGGFAFKSSQYVDEGVRVIRISDFDENGLKGGKVVRYNYSDDLKPYELEVKNILMAMTGGTVGKSYFVESLEERMVVNQRVAAIKLIQPVIESYINCVIPTKLIQGVIAEAKNSTNDNISMSDIKNFNIPLPPLEEQKAIVEVVELLFKEVEQLEQLTEQRIQLKEQFATSALRDLATNNTVKEWEVLKPHFHTFFNEAPNIKKLRETILQLAVQGKLTANWRSIHSPFEGGTGDAKDHDAALLLEKIKAEKAQLIKAGKIKKEKPLPAITEGEAPYDLPEGWVWCRIDSIAENKRNALKAGPFGSALKKEFYVSKGYKIYGQEQVIANDHQIGNYYIDDERFQSLRSCRVNPGDILISLVGTVGKVLILPNNIEPGIINPRLIKVSLHQGISREYFKLFLYSPYLKNFIDDNSQGSTMNIINLKILKQISIPLPPLEEQKSIVETVNRLMALCDGLEEQVTQSKEQVEKWMKGSVREVLGN